MNKVSGIDDDTLLRTADLAARDPFRLGEALIQPGTRTVRGPGGETDLEPRVMQVLVVLADAAGTVVTRETLFQRCWGNAYVGDDSLNRAVAGVRKVAENIAGGSFSVETVPRTGYQLNINSGAHPTSNRDHRSASSPWLSRRKALIAAGGAVVAVVGGNWVWSQRRPDPRFTAVMDTGEKIALSGAYGDPKLAATYQQAVAIDPKSAEAWGRLAVYSCLLREAQTQKSAELTETADRAIDRALAIDPEEPNARTALILLQGPMLDWATRDARIREILAKDPQNIPAMSELGRLLQGAGLTQESWDWNERVLEAAPLSRPHLVMRSLKLWIRGQTAASDKVINRVRGLWPTDDYAYSVRLMLFALTGRPQAALAMLKGEADKFDRTDRIALWKVALAALETRSAADIDAARAKFFDAASREPWQVNVSVMVLSGLGQVDDAFELAEGYLLGRGKVVSADQSDPRVLNDFNRRMTPWLFTPPVATMRADPRFLPLCEELGLTAYWKARGVKPDYLKA